MSYVEKFKNFVTESKRVLRVTKKPTKEEYLTISKVSAIGILIIGFMGFLLHFIKEVTFDSYKLLILVGLSIVVILGFTFWKR